MMGRASRTQWMPSRELAWAILYTRSTSPDADLAGFEEEEADDLLEAVEMELRRRRFNKAVRLEVSHDIGAEVLELLVRELELTMDDVTFHRAPLDLSFLWQLLDLERPDLKDEPWPPVTAGRILAAEETDRPIFDVMRHRAVMVHHPYESFATSVEAFISQAAVDPKVQSIKMTLYRAERDAIAYCESANDFVSRELFESILESEEEHIDWLETQLGLIEKVGIQNYQQSKMST